MQFSVLAVLLLAVAGADASPIASGDASIHALASGTRVQQLAARLPTDYAPRAASCPKTLVRNVKPAGLTGASPDINSDESAFVTARKPIVQRALASWLISTDVGFQTSSADKLPTLALTSSGGGFRAMLNGGGVHVALDKREDSSSSRLKGLYQSLTFESGLSGGGWLVSSLIGNNWPTISNLKQTLWYRTLAFSPLLPNQAAFPLSDVDLTLAVASKAASGFEPTIIDVYGRLLSYTLLKAVEGGIRQTLSSIARKSGFTSHSFPYPIITAIEAPALQQCGANDNSPQFEFTPHEFGSWDAERAAFIPTKYAGSVQGSDGKTSCVQGYDNLGYVLGTSSDIFTELCGPLPAELLEGLQSLANFSQGILQKADNHRPALRDLYAPYPNSFVKQSQPAVRYPPTGRTAATELYLIDGGFSSQLNPIWPFLHRAVDVLFVSDSASDVEGFPDGSDMFNTYTQAQARGLVRMPFIPDNATFQARGYNKRPTFFGCDEPAPVMTIVYFPNNNYVYPSNTSTFKLQYSRVEVDGMLKNGEATATNNGAVGFEVCVGCAVMKKSGTMLPAACTKCFADYCATR